MDGKREPADALGAVLEKRSILSALAEGDASDLNSLVEATEYSRSTINRTVNAFAEMGLIHIQRSSSKHTYEPTALGRELLSVIDCGEALLAKRRLFEGLPTNVDLPPWIVVDGSVEVVNEGVATPHQVFDQVFDVVSRADHLKLVAPVLTRDESFQQFTHQVFEGGMTAELVFPQAHINAISERFSATFERLVMDHDVIVHSLGETVPAYSVGIGYVESTDGSREPREVGVVCYDAERQHATGTVVVSEPAAIAWAEDRFAHFRERANPL